MRLKSDTAYLLAAGMALATTFVIVFLNVAAGMIGIEDDDPANLLYVGVLAIGSIGALAARFQSRGLSNALFATAVAQAAVGWIALRLPNTASPIQIVVVHSIFVVSFAGAALLFRYAASASTSTVS